MCEHKRAYAHKACSVSLYVVTTFTKTTALHGDRVSLCGDHMQFRVLLQTACRTHGSPVRFLQGESRIMSHLHHTATSDIAYRRTSDQAQARPGGQDKGVRHF